MTEHLKQLSDRLRKTWNPSPELMLEAADRIDELTAQRDEYARAADQMAAQHKVERDGLWSALNAMLTQFGIDEDEWSKPTFNQAREALKGWK
jgi:hypothetical protein